MSEFLVSSACKGRKPGKVLGRRLISRPDLVARLLRERHVARFIVAPAGFGKSTLAFEYADTVHSFHHVFWINCKSPCFLRDLDEGVISSRLHELDGSSFLVVFEDVPLLDAPRVESFSLLIDELLEEECEVLATCAPSCDAYADRHRDRLKLAPSDLLLTDGELVAIGKAKGGGEASRVPAAHRIPCMCWGKDDGTDLLTGLVKEELPGDVKLTLFSMLILRSGSWADVEAFVAAGKVRDVSHFLDEGYPLLGIDVRSERFDALPISVEVLARIFDKALNGMASHSYFAGRVALVSRLADALLAQGECERACAVIDTLASRAECAEWLALRGQSLLDAGCLQPAHELHVSLGKNKGEHRAVLNGFEAWRLILLGDREGALSLARRTAYSAKEHPRNRIPSLLVLALHAKEDARRKAVSALGVILGAEGMATVSPNGNVNVGSIGAASDWSAAACCAVALTCGAEHAAEVWVAHFRLREGMTKEGLYAAATMVLDAAAREAQERRRNEGDDCSAGNGRKLGFADDGSLAALAAFTLEALESIGGDDPGFFLSALTLALVRACENGAVPLDFVPRHRQVVLARHIELGMYEQRTEYGASVERVQDERAEYRATHPDAFRACSSSKDALPPTKVAPMLHVNLFGGLEVRIGDRVVDPLLLRRRKVKILLALLVLNKGHELSRDRILGVLWPGADTDAARKNLYSVWSQLRHALSTSDGLCPYLIRERGGCRLDARSLECDVAQFDEVCRALLFGRIEGEEWERLLAIVHERFADDLLPGEQENDYIIRTRREFCMRLVDGLLAASSRLVKAGEVNGGLWFAREALRRDKTREDVYVALMEAQLASGQRAAALETYFALRRFLAEELGIDPSTRTVRLYRDIIESEDVVDW